MSDKTLSTVIQLYRLLKSFLSKDDAVGLTHAFIKGVHQIVGIRYYSIFLRKEEAHHGTILKSSYMIVGNTGNFHNELWNIIEDGLKDSYSCFNLKSEDIIRDLNDFVMGVVEIEDDQPVLDDPSEISVIFQMPLVIRDKIIGVMLFIDHNSVNLSQEELTVIGLLSDQFTVVFENCLLMDEVKQIAITDGLTGIYSRRYFLERLQEEFHRAKRFSIPLSLLMIDLDHFKEINDQYGHQAGDYVLEAITSIFQENIRGIDLVGRYGGEEFVMLFPHTKEDGAITVTKRIKKQIAKTIFNFNGENITVTASFGMAVYPNPRINSIDDFIKIADRVLYSAKENGRNRICINSDNSVKTIK